MSLARILRYASEALRLMLQGRFGVLREKRGRLSLAAGPLISVEALASSVAEVGSVVCIVDGAQGGGAAAAARRSANEWRAQGLGTLQLGCDPLGNLSVTFTGTSESQALTGRLAAWPPLPPGVTSIEVHSLAGFTEPGQLASWLVAATQGDITLSIHWHDHYFICPTRHLRLPATAIAACRMSAFAANACRRTRIASTHRCAKWMWLLARKMGRGDGECPEIRVFSDSSGELIRQYGRHSVTLCAVSRMMFLTFILAPLTPQLIAS